MVQSEYGWSDEYVLGLTVARLRAIIDNIRERVLADYRHRAKLVEWQTRTVAQFIAATTGKEGATLQREANKVTLDLDEADTEAGAAVPRGDYTIEDYDWVENGSPTAASRNRPGSAERLMGGFRM